VNVTISTFIRPLFKASDMLWSIASVNSDFGAFAAKAASAASGSLRAGRGSASQLHGLKATKNPPGVTEGFSTDGYRKY
jgi:hypothetical protein